MPGLGTVINVAAIVAGGIAGLAFGKLLKEDLRDGLTKACGVCVLFLGIAGAMEGMLSVDAAGSLTSGNSLLIIASIALGTLLGELLGIDALITRFGEWLKAKTGNARDKNFVEGFVVTSITVCVGAMAVMGAIEDGLFGDISILQAKAILDFIIVMVLACSLGKGCAFSAIPVGIFQGSITALAAFIKPLMTAAALANLSLVGSILIFCVGVNLVWGNKVRVANMLPAVIIAPALAFLPL